MTLPVAVGLSRLLQESQAAIHVSRRSVAEAQAIVAHARAQSASVRAVRRRASRTPVELSERRVTRDTGSEV
jgi:hypothetical protein